jgi:glucokinase
MQQGNFMQAFLDKGRMNSLLKQMPVHIVLNRKVGLIGAALCADQLTFS